MLWHIGRPIGRRIPMSKGYSKEITIIYTVRAYKRRSRVARYLPPVFHVCMHTCSILSRDPTIFVPRKGETHWCSRLKINQAQTCYAHIGANHMCPYNFNFLSTSPWERLINLQLCLNNGGIVDRKTKDIILRLRVYKCRQMGLRYKIISIT